MKSLIGLRQRRLALVVAGAVAAAVAIGATSAQAQGNGDILWRIVSNCLGADAAARAQACPAPRQVVPLAEMRFADTAEATRACRRGTEVWDEAPERFVAIRDIKMCACPENRDFLHGLALPYARVHGVESAQRPDGIWAFAWQVGIARLGAAGRASLALAVNPTARRTQDQLHVHIVRLREDYLRRLQEHPEYVLSTVRLKDLNEVWRAAPPPQGTVAPFTDFGLLLVSDGADGYLLRVVSAQVSPEDEYTQWRCPG